MQLCLPKAPKLGVFICLVAVNAAIFPIEGKLLWQSQNRAGRLAASKRDYAEAERQYSKSLTIARYLPWKNCLAISLCDTADSMLEQGKADSSVEDMLKSALALITANKTCSSSTHVKCEVTLANLYQLQYRFALAEEHYKMAQKIAINGSHVQSACLATVLNDHGTLHQEAGEYYESIDYFRTSIEKGKDDFGDNPDGLNAIKDNLADSLAAVGQYNEAEALYEEVIASRKVVLNQDSFRLSNSMNSLLSLYCEIGDFRRAHEVAGQLIQLANARTTNKEWSLAYAKLAQSYVYFRQGCLGQSERICFELLAPTSDQTKSDKALISAVRARLASIYQDTRRKSMAELIWKDLLKEDLDASKPKVVIAKSHLNLGYLYSRTEQAKEAEIELKKALSIDNEIYGESSVASAYDRLYLGRVYRLLNKDNLAEQALQKAYAILTREFGECHTRVAWDLYTFAKLREKQKRNAEAATLYQRAFEIYANLNLLDHPDRLFFYHDYSNFLKATSGDDTMLQSHIKTINQTIASQK